ncbi:hypothetical protein MMC24_000134 [Lignoscripta atroalba]|nr:hypothetical protein [Lignoscripta atroalba]
MSFLIRTAFRPISRLNASRSLTIGVTRSLHVSSARAALSENDRHRDGMDHEIDHHKNDQIQKQKEGKGEWKGELASQSEAAIKADRGDIDSSEDTINKLQKETENFAEEQHKGSK